MLLILECKTEAAAHTVSHSSDFRDDGQTLTGECARRSVSRSSAERGRTDLGCGKRQAEESDCLNVSKGMHARE